MKTRKDKPLLMLSFAASLLAFSACTDDKYDLSDLDTTIAVGSDSGLKLPSSSTKQIVLDDLLELNDSKTVVIDSHGDYLFQQQGDDVTPVRPNIERIFVSEESTSNYPVLIEVKGLPDGFDLIPVGTELPGTAGSLTHEIQTFNYKGTLPDEVKSLKAADVEGGFNVEISFNDDLKGYISAFKIFKVEFPLFMEFEVASASQDCTKEGNVLTFNEVPSSKSLNIVAKINKLDFTKSNATNSLTLSDGNVSMVGDVKVNVEYGDAKKGSGNVKNLQINSTVQISTLTIVSATGSFSPEIKIEDLGGVTLDDLPDFLTDDDVVVDLYNPQIIIDIQSDLSVPGLLKGTLVAKDEMGKEMSRVNIPQVKINAIEDNAGKSCILICRQQPSVAEQADYTDVAVVPELSNIIRKIPHTISFETEASADASRDDSFILLGHDYTIKPSYRIEAPLAFGADARIVYTDRLDGWNDDIQDYEFADDSYLRVTAEIENKVPAHLVMSAQAIDVRGNEIDNLAVDVDKTIAASDDGATAKTTPLTIMVKQKSPGALKAVDGIIFTIKAAAADGGNSAVVNKTLNAYNQNLTAKNIVVELVGRVVIKSDD